jgi:hypothetical protein
MMGIGMALMAQQKDGNAHSKKEKLETLKMAYFSKELALTTTESEKFWPIYNEMNEKIKQNRKEKRSIAKNLKENVTTLKEEEIKQKIEQIYQKELEEVNLKKNYGDKIAGVIGYPKAVQLAVLEHQFRQEVISQLKKKAQQTTSPAKE